MTPFLTHIYSVEKSSVFLDSKAGAWPAPDSHRETNVIQPSPNPSYPDDFSNPLHCKLVFVRVVTGIEPFDWICLNIGSLDLECPFDGGI